MPRLVRFDATGPIKIDPNAPPGTPNAWPRDDQGNLKPVWVCACGLSATFPICDKAHLACTSEDPGTLYEYDASRAIVSARPVGDRPAPRPGL